MLRGFQIYYLYCIKKISEKIPFVCRHDLKTKTGKYTKTETENISKLTAYKNQLMCWGPVFVYYRFQFLLLHSFVFFSSYNAFICYFTIIKNQKIFVSKTNLRRSYFTYIVLIRCNTNTTWNMYSFQLPGVYRNKKNTISKKIPLLYYRTVHIYSARFTILALKIRVSLPS